MENNNFLFNREIKDTFILNIPHASINIPNYNGYVINIDNEVNLLTDHATDKIFDVSGINKLVCDFNRVFCDVERFSDGGEIMEKFGMGFIYTHTDQGNLLREVTPEIKGDILEHYYLPYHNKLTQLVDDKLLTNNIVRIVDCHSFTNTPFKRDLDQTINRPDICIGIDEYHTPNYLLDYIKIFFESYGLSVKINSPYSGSIVPQKYYLKNKGVESIMIEINRNLYMKNSEVVNSDVINLNKIINRLFLF